MLKSQVTTADGAGLDLEAENGGMRVKRVPKLSDKIYLKMIANW